MNDRPDKIRIRKAVELFDLSESWFRHAISSRKIPAYRLGGAIFLSRKEIERLIEDSRVQ